MSAVKMSLASRPTASVAPASLPQSLPLPPPPLVDGRSLSGPEGWGCKAADASADAGSLQGSCRRGLGEVHIGRVAGWVRCEAAPGGVELPRSRSLHLHLSIQKKFCLFQLVLLEVKTNTVLTLIMTTNYPFGHKVGTCPQLFVIVMYWTEQNHENWYF